jgi:hypothetical protein
MSVRTRWAAALAAAVTLGALILVASPASAVPPAPAAGIAASSAQASMSAQRIARELTRATTPVKSDRATVSRPNLATAAWHGSDYIELRYSNYCQTLWIRGNAYVCCSNAIGAAMSTHPYSDYGTTYGSVYLPAGNGVRYSAMLNDAGRCGRGQIYAAGSAYAWTTCY